MSSSSINIPAYGEALAANGTTGGVVQVVDTTKYGAGCEAWLSDTTGLTSRVKIMKIVDSTHMLVQVLLDSGSNVNSLSYGASDVSAFHTANTARIDMPSQMLHVDNAYNRRSTP